jgi:murein endopeptidase
MRRAALLLVLFAAILPVACASGPRGGPKSGSVGRPNDGALYDGVPLLSSGDLVVLTPDHAWGTRELVDLIEAVAREMRLAYPDTAPLVVGDLSLERGGRLGSHLSHQSGRDADLGFYYLDNQPHRRFADGAAGEIDSLKTWYLIEMILEKGKAQYLLLDHEVQRTIYEEVSIVVPEQRLLTVFQYPRGRRARVGVVRHAPRHRDHLHLRIHCPRDDAYCID